MPVADSCPSTFQTSIGKILKIDDKLLFADSEKYCASINATLAPINTQKVVTEIATILESCTDTQYAVGLKLMDEQGTWSDGQAYDQATQEALFQFQRPAKCLEVYFNRKFKKLVGQLCTAHVSPFLCLTEPMENSILDEEWFYIGLLTLVGLIIGFIVGFCFFVIRKVKRKNRSNDMHLRLRN